MKTIPDHPVATETKNSTPEITKGEVSPCDYDCYDHRSSVFMMDGLGTYQGIGHNQPVGKKKGK
jgi:hypothetical protein